MNLSLDKDHIITIILDGYKQETIEVKRKFKNNDMVASHLQIFTADTPEMFTFEKNTIIIPLKKK